MTTAASLVLSVVDGRTKVAHLVHSETLRWHRQSGRYPTLCDDNVPTASLTTEPVSECTRCQRTLGKAEQ